MFDARVAPVVARWSTEREATLMWCSLPEVTGDVVAAWSESPSVEAYVLCDDGAVVGYGEIWIDAGENEVELAHLIVDPARRNRGLGRQLVAGLVEQAQRHYPVVAMRVHSQNEAAIRTYVAAGFRRASQVEEQAWNVGQPVDYVWMTRHVGTTS